MIESLRHRTLLIGWASGALATLGIVGYVGGRLTADNRFVGLVLFSTYLILAGLAVFALALFINTSRMRRPLVSISIGVLVITYGLLLMVFPYDRAFAYPGGAIAASLVVLFALGWNDICNPSLWNPPTTDDLGER
jgi:CHASE2 domain-containing sensor protein